MRSVTGERVWVGSCRKWRYQTRPEAMDALAKARENRPVQQEKERSAYRCASCEGWHLSRRTSDNPNDNAPELGERGLDFFARPEGGVWTANG